MDPHPLANIFKRSNYDEQIASEFYALDYLYEALLKICESEIYEEIRDNSLNKKQDCNDFPINSLDVNCANICKTLSLGMLVLLCLLLVSMIMIGVILLITLKIYLSPMMNMRLIILKVGLERS